ncbi:MAG: helix-turn-helix domain-containing protein, partial [Nitrososphaeria archaeon]
MILLSEGRSTKEVAGILKRSIRSVERWIKSWNEGG